jgi:guanylate kinase
VGKSSVVAEVRRRHPEIWYSMSVTTRPRRPGETEGVDYHFVTDGEFDRMVGAGELLEHAVYAGHRYGTTRRPIEEHLDAGVPTLLEIDLQGARQVRRQVSDALLVFLAPPSWEELARRLVDRRTEDPAVIRRRLDAARIELAAEEEFDAVVVNSSVPKAAEQLVALMSI